MDIPTVTLNEQQQINLILKLGSVSHDGKQFTFQPKTGLYKAFSLPDEKWMAIAPTLTALVTRILNDLTK